MELKAKDIYKIECADFLSKDMLASLFSLYQPIIGIHAINLYMTLYIEGMNQRTQESHSRLLTTLNMTIDDFVRSRTRLEEFMLMRVYQEEQENRTNYIYILYAPLPAESFFSSKALMNRFVESVGQKHAELTIQKLSPVHLSTTGYKDVTKKVSYKSYEQDYDNSIVYHKVLPRYQFELEGVNINFDYERFFATTSPLVFPTELRTQENLMLIGQLATIYGLSVDRMRILVNRCADINAMAFDGEKLKLLAEKSKPDITSAKDIYSLPPVSFLQAKQNGAEVSLADRKILEDLSLKMHFPPEVINIMIEYILKRSQNRLVKQFVDMVAGEWARDGVKTREDALKETKKKNTKFAKKSEKELPAYMSETKQEETTVSEEELQEVQKLLKKVGDKK